MNKKGLSHFEIIMTLLILMAGIALIILLFEVFLSTLFGEIVTIYEECKNDYGQTIIDSECKRETNCLNWGLLQKTCEELRE